MIHGLNGADLPEDVDALRALVLEYPARSTLAERVSRAAWYLRPLRERILAELRQAERLFADETTAPVLDPGGGRTKTGQLWAYARDN